MVEISRWQMEYYDAKVVRGGSSALMDSRNSRERMYEAVKCIERTQLPSGIHSTLRISMPSVSPHTNTSHVLIYKKRHTCTTRAIQTEVELYRSKNIGRR